ncbi:MAG: hypothetical protein AAGC53_10585 [Actinomycetota bacterium]
MADIAVREVVTAVRIASTAEALDAAVWPADATPLRLAPDDVLLVGVRHVEAPEPHAIVFVDTGWARFRVSPIVGAELMRAGAAWPAPASGLGQGMILGVPAKLVVADGEWWVLVLGAVADEFEERLHEVFE